MEPSADEKRNRYLALQLARPHGRRSKDKANEADAPLMVTGFFLTELEVRSYSSTSPAGADKITSSQPAPCSSASPHLGPPPAKSVLHSPSVLPTLSNLQRTGLQIQHDPRRPHDRALPVRPRRALPSPAPKRLDDRILPPLVPPRRLASQTRLCLPRRRVRKETRDGPERVPARREGDVDPETRCVYLPVRQVKG